MESFGLGPNGGMVYCMEFLEENAEWLTHKIQESKARYFVFDLPGQVELYTNHRSLRNVLTEVGKATSMSFSAVHLVDAVCLYDKFKFLGSLCLSLTATIGFDMPFLNVISKLDLLKQMGRPDMGLDFYSSCSGLKYLFFGAEDEQSPLSIKYHKLTSSLCDLIDTKGGVGFCLLDISDKYLLSHVVGQLDKGNGFHYSDVKNGNEKEMQIDYEAIATYIETVSFKTDTV